MLLKLVSLKGGNTIGQVMIILYIVTTPQSLQQQLATEAKPRTKLTDYRDRSRQYTLGKWIILTKYSDKITTSITAYHREYHYN